VNKMNEYEYDLTIVGNGYDKALGYLTGYDNFYDVLSICLMNNVNVINELKKYFQIDDSEINILKNRGLLEFIELTKEKNIFISYFTKKIKYNFWNSFEDELMNILTKIDIVFSKVRNSNFYYSDNNLMVKIDNSNFEEEFLDQIDKVINFDFISTRSIGIIIEGFKYDKRKNICADYINKWIENKTKIIYDELQKFSDLFVRYLNIVVNGFEFSNKKRFKYYSLRFLNYNYTNTCPSYLNGECSTIHINGSYNCDDNSNVVTSSSIVFGVSDYPFENRELNIFKKIIQRAILKTDYTSLFNLRKANRYAILGHSLSECDYDSLKYLFFNNDNIKSIHIYYYKEYEISLFATSMLNILGKEKYEDLFYSGSLKYLDCKDAYIDLN